LASLARRSSPARWTSPTPPHTSPLQLVRAAAIIAWVWAQRGMFWPDMPAAGWASLAATTALAWGLRPSPPGATNGLAPLSGSGGGPQHRTNRRPTWCRSAVRVFSGFLVCFALCRDYLTQRGSGAAEGVPAVLVACLGPFVVRLEEHSTACNIFKLLSRETTNHAHTVFVFAHLT
jgi:hypothetical protein